MVGLSENESELLVTSGVWQQKQHLLSSKDFFFSFVDRDRGTSVKRVDMQQRTAGLTRPRAAATRTQP